MTTRVPAVARDNSILRRRRREVIVGVVLLAVLIVLPLPIDDVTTRNIMILTVLYAGLAQAWNVLGGYCGQISLGHALYFGVGGYVSTLLFVQGGIPPTIGMLAAGIVAALCALLVGWPCFRLTGHYYAIATVVVGELGYLLFQNWNYVGGDSGVYVPIMPNSWITLQFGKEKLPYYYVMLAFAAITWVVAWVVEGARVGFAWRAVKDDVIAARSLGVRIFRSKMIAAAISGFFTGMGGAIYAQYVGYIDPDSMLNSSLSILIALPAVLGGVGTLWGPIIGAFVLIPVSEVSRSYLGGSGSGVDLMLYGLLIVVVALARPQGLVSLLGQGFKAGRAKAGGVDASVA
jgi:branched-chain amino acid transport system permease protein